MSDRSRILDQQSERRASRKRIDYYVDSAAQAAIERRRASEQPGSVAATNSAVINAIVCEWAELVSTVNSDPRRPQERRGHRGNDRDHSPRAPSDGSGRAPELRQHSRACARANDFGTATVELTVSSPVVRAPQPTACGARRRRDGEPCQAPPALGKRRCRWHGGFSTGPKTDAGKLRALSNLRRGR